MFDLYIRKPPKANLLKDRKLADLLSASYQAARSWLGVSLTYEEAARTAKSIEDAGGDATVAKIEYRQPLVSLDHALSVASLEIAKIAKQTASELGIPIALEKISVDQFSDHPRVWTFCAKSPTLQVRGYIPGAICANIDKVTGSLVSNRELMEETDRLREAQGVVFDA